MAKWIAWGETRLQKLLKKGVDILDFVCIICIAIEAQIHKLLFEKLDCLRA